MLSDSSRAAHLDPASFKALKMCGEACVLLGMAPKVRDLDLIDRGLSHLNQALHSCQSAPKTDSDRKVMRQLFEKQIKIQILRAKKIRWFKLHDLALVEKKIILEELRVALNIDEQPLDPSEDIVEKTEEGAEFGTPIGQG